MTERLHHQDPYLLDFEATVVEVREHEGRPAVVLDRTAFYAESGGQPWDTGTLGDATVVAVVEDGDEVLHVVDRPLAPGAVRGHVDGERRRDHMQQHHGQHLLSRAFVEVAQAQTIAFHLGSEATTIDLDREVTTVQANAAERRANEVIWEARPVRVEMVTAEDARATGVEPPEGVTEGIRVVEALGFDRQPCGGTHPRTTAEVGFVVLTGIERYKGKSRVSFVCGHRALVLVGRQRSALDQLVAAFSAPVAELPDVARRLKADLADGERRERALVERALEGEARRLLAEAKGEAPASPSKPTVVVASYDGWTPDDLRILALRLVAREPCVALLGSRAEKAHLVIAQSDGLTHDVPALLRSALELLGGKGGGRGNVAQGGGDRPERLDEALARAAETVRARS
jgi:alanyl-tRNA synthetase